MEQNDGYVYGQSILMSDKKFKEWVLDQSDYKYDEEIDEHGNKIIFKHKSRVYAKKVTLENKKGSDACLLKYIKNRWCTILKNMQRNNAQTGTA